MMDPFQVHVMEDLRTYSILLGESVKKTNVSWHKNGLQHQRVLQK